MSEGNIFVGDFEVDPDLIPEAPQVPLGVPLVFEIVKATRISGDKVGEDGEPYHFVYNDLQCRAVDVSGTPSVFPRLWVTERFERSANRSWKHFLRVCKLPFSTRAEFDLAGFKFKGTARKGKRDDGVAELASVIGPV